MILGLKIPMKIYIETNLDTISFPGVSAVPIVCEMT